MQKKLLIAAIFLGSFISFALEPMIGRALLPVFGGTPMVWVTCLGAFQLLMVGGYFYGDRGMGSGERRTGKSLWRHLVLLLLAGGWCCSLSFCSAPVLSAVSSLTGVAPIDVLVAVLALVGIAFVLLSANATIVQNLSGGDYRLYAVSNLGSLLGLFAYPLLVEPFVSLSNQWSMLGGGILAYAAILLVASRSAVAQSTRYQAPSTNIAPSTKHQAPSTIFYFLIPAVSCALLNSVTTHLTLDILPLPLLWAVLLGIFLLSYIVGFSGRGKSAYWAIPAAGSVIVAYWGFASMRGNDVAQHLPIGASLLFFVCTFLHSWLYELRPEKELLGRYYLLNVIGGAVGGVLTSIVAPLVFSTVAEYPILIVISALGLVFWTFRRYSRVPAAVAFAAFALYFIVSPLVGGALSDGEDGKRWKTVFRDRGFFGTINVNEISSTSSDGQAIKIHDFYHGSTMHGVQIMRKEMAKMPTAYYSPYGCGFAIWGHPSYFKDIKPMRVQLVGLGVGVLYSYSRAGDYYHAYEISPETLAVAQDSKLFSFISDSPAKKEIVLADARKGLEKELADGVEPYDVIVVDAFSGDSIPYHLSTKEAIELYFKLLKEDGVLCVHFSNKHLDLRPYIKRIGLEFGIEPIVLKCIDDRARLAFATDVAFFTRHPEKLRGLPVVDGHATRQDLSSVKPMAYLPTDDKGSFLPLVDFSENK